MSLVRALVDNDLAFAISILDLAGPLVKDRPIQPDERRIIEMAFDDVADIGRLTIAIGAGQIELAAAVDLAIAVVVSFALEEPLIIRISERICCCVTGVQGDLGAPIFTTCRSRASALLRSFRTGTPARPP